MSRHFFSIGLVPKKAIHALFLGDLVGSPLAMDNGAFPEAMVYRIIDEGINAIEIMDMATRNIVAYASLYIDEDGKENIEWAVENREEAFMLREIKSKFINNVTYKLVDVTFFIDGAETPQYNTLTQKTVLNVDFEKDVVNDLSVRIVSFDDESENVTFEFKIPDNRNVKYRPTDFVNKTSNSSISGSVGNTPINIAAGGDKIGFLWIYKRVIAKITANWELSISIAILILILALNKRGIEKFLRRAI